MHFMECFFVVKGEVMNAQIQSHTTGPLIVEMAEK